MKRLVYVTSDVTYVRDNYLSLLQKITLPENLPEGCQIAGAVLLKVPTKLLLKNIIGLQLLGAPDVSFALLRNMLKARLNDPRVKLLQQRGIEIFRCSSVNKPEALEFLAGLKPDLMVNMRTRNIYKKPVLDLPSVGCINIHHGLLPENRGTMCDLWAWIEDRPVGFSIHWMNEKIDDGDILERCQIDTTGCRSYIDIPYRSSQFEADCLLRCIGRISREGRFVGVPNRTDQINYTRTPSAKIIAEVRRSGKRL
ncbi:MAG: methionyl-tRNA formyltransferase [Clostridiales bacterium]|jgi:folate-dependent phosphoribosylglycinamide formyltransferase PurN|nr:methionyl-tRNA formyltransferase [Clostridiales bacterium]MDN5282483.1 methionyl-tRNA formyltransferase [Candidatus Ozemobacter sp.]